MRVLNALSRTLIAIRPLSKRDQRASAHRFYLKTLRIRVRACQMPRNTRSRDARRVGGQDLAIQFGLWLSLVERCVRDAEAVGSNPTSPIIFVRSGGTLKLLSHFS